MLKQMRQRTHAVCRDNRPDAALPEWETDLPQLLRFLES